MRKKVIAILLSLTIVLGNSSMVFASANTEMENSVQAVVEEQEETQTGETQTYQATSTQKNVVESENEVNPVSTNADDDVLSYTITDPTKKTVAVKGNGKSLNMTSITIPSTTEIDGVTYTVTALDISAFCSHSALETVTIPETIETIGENAFQECSSLLSVSIPNSVTSIGNSVFEECSSLSSAKFR